MPVYLQYYFWLMAISLFCFLAERINPWRKQQKILREGIGQDLFWLVFNGHYLGVLLAIAIGKILFLFNSFLSSNDVPLPESFALLSGLPFWLQFLIFFIAKDFIEWNIHRLLHNVPWLWELHKLHHSIKELDWIGNFRFHWGEVIVYKTLSYLPLVIMGADSSIVFLIAIIGTLMQDLNHANLSIDWGPFKYIFNSPLMHVWHHDVEVHGKGGQNFGIVLSIWDWLFGTVYWPKNEIQPEEIGFEGMEATYPENLLARIVYPFWKRGGDIKKEPSN